MSMESPLKHGKKQQHVCVCVCVRACVCMCDSGTVSILVKALTLFLGLELSVCSPSVSFGTGSQPRWLHCQSLMLIWKRKAMWKGRLTNRGC